MADDTDGIARFREEIDEIDSELLKLLNRRAACALSIGEIKQRSNQPIYVPARETSVLERMVAENGGPLTPESVRNLFQTVFDQMKILESGVKG